MAAADYRLCDVCGGKAFYDANLNHQQDRDWKGRKLTDEDYARVCGEVTWASSQIDYLGDWAVICTDCAKTHRTLIVPIEEPKP